VEFVGDLVVRKPEVREERQDRSSDIRKQEVDPFPDFLASLEIESCSVGACLRRSVLWAYW